MIQFIVTFCLFSILVDATNVVVEEQMRCEMLNEWNYRVTYVEYDHITANEVLLETELVTVKGHWGPKFTRRYGVHDGDGTVRRKRSDLYYELKMYITHTCKYDAQYVGFYEDLGVVEVRENDARFQKLGLKLDTECNFFTCWRV